MKRYTWRRCAYRFAQLYERVYSRCSEVIQDLIVQTMLILARQFPKHSKQARAVLKVITQLIGAADFRASVRGEQAEDHCVAELFRICKGISLMTRANKSFTCQR